MVAMKLKPKSSETVLHRHDCMDWRSDGPSCHPRAFMSVKGDVEVDKLALLRVDGRK